MLILAHRGHHADLPENTLTAFEAAIHLGADGIETDIQVTRDGIPILFHDRVLRGIEISALTHAELSQRAGYEVPTLISALDAWPDIFWNLELKMPTDLAPVWPILREYRLKRRLLVSSFWHPAAIQAGRDFGVGCGLLVAHRPLRFDALLTGLLDGLPPGQLSVVWECSSVDAELTEATAAVGVYSYVYGPQTMADHVRLEAWGVGGVITDHLAAACEADGRDPNGHSFMLDRQ